MTAAPPESPGEDSRPSRRPRHRRAWTVGLSVSVGVHLLLLVLYSGVSGPPTVSVAPSGEGSTELQGLELLNLVAQVEEELERPEEPEEEETERQPIPVQPRPAAPSDQPSQGGIPGAGQDEELGPTAAERLRVPLRTDRRLWAPMASEEFGSVSMQRFLESDLAWRLGLWNDSVAMEAARQREGLDWTYTDGEGGRWGISPEGIHLGDVTLPLPTFAPAYGAARERAFIDQELARGAASSLIWESLQERAEAIRERRDREREEERSNPTRLGPRRARPDTTSGGGGG